MLYRLEGARLPQESRGQIVPELYGGLHRDVPGLPLQVGYSALLADNCGATTAQTVLLLSGPDLDVTLAALTLPTVAQIDDEWLLVNAFLQSPWRIVVERGYSLTDPAEHEKGATVLFLESRPLYVFASAPPGCRYPNNALVQLRINDVAQTPPSTVRLQDMRIIPGARFVTAEFDLSRMFGAMPTPTAPQTVVFDQPTPRFSGSRVASVPRARAADLLMGRATQGLQTQRLLGADLRSRHLSAPPPPPPSPAPARAVAPGSAGTVTSTPIRVLPSPLGRVTADLLGLIDTPAGRYTGVSASPLTEPVPITQCILESSFGETRRHLPTWTTTRAVHRALSPGVTWTLAWRGEDFESFRVQAGFNGYAVLWLDDTGQWRYTVDDPTVAPVATLTGREILGDVALGFIPASATKLAVSWGQGLEAGTFTLDSPTMVNRYGVVTERTLSLPYIATEAAARVVAQRWLAQWDRDRWTATVAVGPGQSALTLTDRVVLETDLLQTYGLQTRVAWQIRGSADRGEQRVLTLVEGDATAIELGSPSITPTTGTLALTASVPDLTGRPTPATATLSLTGSVPELVGRLGPAAGALVLAGAPPTLELSVGGPRPASAGLVLTGSAPVVQVPGFATPTTAALALTGQAPVLQASVSLTLPTATLALVGAIPSLGDDLAAMFLLLEGEG